MHWGPAISPDSREKKDPTLHYPLNLKHKTRCSLEESVGCHSSSAYRPWRPNPSDVHVLSVPGSGTEVLTYITQRSFYTLTLLEVVYLFFYFFHLM